MRTKDLIDDIEVYLTMEGKHPIPEMDSEKPVQYITGVGIKAHNNTFRFRRLLLLRLLPFNKKKDKNLSFYFYVLTGSERGRLVNRL